MKKAKELLFRLIYPPKWVIVTAAVVSAAVLWFVFSTGKTNCAAAYFAYLLSAYALTILAAAMPKAFSRI